ncbi:hypothetical protein DFH08DRAFT_814832 [Mycena albidolilacea]|uniref:Uncharacterized protein n=1 Tax=Mycena albidolilacea TaxID=1033008 RepID=A0AAD6ZPA2_9AGAR|nr:hypothetical protein DFH08DRAFT_814832 [Mycena albidolilacea]
MFEAGETIPSGEIKSYRDFAFPPALGDPTDSPFFSVENASTWITSHGYQLYLQHNDSDKPAEEERSSVLVDSKDGSVVRIWGVRVKQKKSGEKSEMCRVGVKYGWRAWKVFTGDVLTVEHSGHWSRRSWWFGGPVYRKFGVSDAHTTKMLGDHFLGHLFFDLDNTDAWMSPVAFQAYMNTVYGPFDEYRTQNSTPFSSRPPSRAGSSASSRAPSRGDSGFSAAGSRSSSRASFVAASRTPSSRAPSPFNSSVIFISDSDSDNFPATDSAASTVPKIEPGSASPLSIHPTGSSHRIGRNGKEKAATSKIQLTRQEAVDEIIQISMIPSTWTVPRIPAAYLVDLSNTLHSLKVGNRTLTIDRFIRTEMNLKIQDQDSWGGSSGHSVGDSDAAGFLPALTMAIKCRRAHLKCKGVYTCEFIDPTLFAGCERYEPDPAATQALWKHELDANEREAASVPGIISRLQLTPSSSFYNRIMSSKCKVQCDGVPVFKHLSGGAVYGKQFFIGCSKWTRALKFEHRYLPIPSNVDEDTLRIAMENGGQLPTAPTVNEMCALTVHPRIGKRLKMCRCHLTISDLVHDVTGAVLEQFGTMIQN